MGGRELDQHVLALDSIHPEAQQQINRRAAVNVADRIASEHPHALDLLMPKLAGRTLAKDPAIAAGVLELLETLGLPTRKEKR